MWLSKDEVCALLRISKPTLNRWMRIGKIPYYKSGTQKSCKVLFKNTDVGQLLENMKK